MTRHQRGPNSAHHTHKQKKAQLQEARRRARDREATDEAEDAYEAALVSAANRVPKVVQARLYTYREHRGGAVHVRLRLAIDRQQCAGFVPGLPAGVLPPLPAGVLPPPPPVSSSPHLAELRNADARRARDWARRGKALRTALSETTRLKSLTEVERQWMASVSACAQLIEEVRAEFTIGTVAPGAAGASTSYGPHPWLFGLVQQALQTGPLAFGKPAQLKRMAKGLEGKPGKTLESGLHPHARCVRELLSAMGTLARALEAQQFAAAAAAAEAAAAAAAVAAAAGATGGGGGDAGTVEDDGDDAARGTVLVEEKETNEEEEEEEEEDDGEGEEEEETREAEAAAEVVDGASGAAVGAARAVEDNTPSVTLSSRQREIVAAWIAEFGQAFGVGVDGEPVPSAPGRGERSRRGACAVLGAAEVGGIRFGAAPLLR